MTRAPQPTLLAPDIVEAIPKGTQAPEMTLAQVLKPFAMEWKVQVALFMQT